MTTFLLNYWPNWHQNWLIEFIKMKFVILKHLDKKFPLIVKYYLNIIILSWVKKQGVKRMFWKKSYGVSEYICNNFWSWIRIIFHVKIWLFLKSLSPTFTSNLLLYSTVSCAANRLRWKIILIRLQRLLCIILPGTVHFPTVIYNSFPLHTW